jgi:arsenate reductase
MAQFTIIHNPRCSKSRKTLELLQAQTDDINIIEYLVNTPSKEELKSIFSKLGKEPKEVVRTKEEDYKALEINWNDSDAVLEAIVKFPKILERPIVVSGDRAVIGRPPENVEELF